MATPREIKLRIKSVSNTEKITRTMELVSTAKSKKSLDRLVASRPYSKGLKDLLDDVSATAKSNANPYFKTDSSSKKNALVVVTSNRGLCGGYNTNILNLAIAKLSEYKDKNQECDLYVVGKKGATFFRYKKITIKKAYLEIDEKITYNELEVIAQGFIDAFLDDEYAKVDILYTKYHNSALQKATPETLLPFGSESVANESVVNESIANKEIDSETQMQSSGVEIYEPNKEEILNSILPLYAKTKIFQCFLDAYCSEHIHRRIAMKSATDAASDMIQTLTRDYNRVRQGKITQEIAEIQGGIAAL